jgi:hypothetical protein
MYHSQAKGTILLLITALIWGAAFVAQSVGMDYIGPFTFSAARDVIAIIVLIPVILLFTDKGTDGTYPPILQQLKPDRITLIGCPKLDDIDYAEKLTEILRQNDIHDVTLVRMEVPCCGGLEMAAKRALAQSGKDIPFEVRIISLDGKIKG